MLYRVVFEKFSVRTLYAVISILHFEEVLSKRYVYFYIIYFILTMIFAQLEPKEKVLNFD